MLCGFIWLYYMGEKKIQGFVWGSLSAFFWFIVSTLILSWAGMIANAVIFVLNILGYFKWRAQE